MTKPPPLGKRLSAIAQCIEQHHQQAPYDTIWDCCCDHGYLGLYLLDYFSTKDTHNTHVNFVDQVPHITQKLAHTLEQTPSSAHHVYTLKTEHLRFDKTQQHCIIIAGVTTTGTLKILQALLTAHPSQALDFILCPTRGQYELRQYLIHKKLVLINEMLIEERGRYYEILHVRQDVHTKHTYKHITPTGEFWQEGNTEHLTYLKSRIDHYQKEALDTHNTHAKKASQHYLGILKNKNQHIT